MKKSLSVPILSLVFVLIVIYLTASCKNEIIEIESQLSITDSLLSVTANTNSTDTFIISSNTSWTITSSKTWLTVSPTSGSNTDTIIVSALENTDALERMATVTVSAKGLPSQILTVKQSGIGFNMVVSRKSISIAELVNSSDTFVISSNTNWKVLSSASWLTCSPSSGLNNGIITLTATQPSTTSKTRNATVTVSGTETTSQIVKVTQLGIPCKASDETYCEVSGCIIPTLPTYSSLSNNSYFPNPFLFLNGSTVSTKDDWTCRRAEIAVLAQEFEYGYKPCTSYMATKGSFSSNSIKVTVSDNGKTISFNCSITYPSSGTAPYPAIIGIGYSFLDNALLSNLGVAVINFPNDDIALQDNSGSRGKGKFYDFFCSDHSAGALMAWAWGVSRLIDAIETTPGANIDPIRLGVTGCSRNGKGALCAGAFDERIVLTIPQESGSGGAASWRVSDFQGSSVQRLQQIVTENCWFRKSFSQFSNTANKLPFDHHMIEALCAPRALLVIENTSMVWLGNESTWTTANAAHMVWEALGIPDFMGFSQYGHADHCGYPVAQQPELEVFVQKFLVGGGISNTQLMKTDGNLTFNKEKWINWTVPTLK